MTRADLQKIAREAGAEARVRNLQGDWRDAWRDLERAADRLDAMKARVDLSCREMAGS